MTTHAGTAILIRERKTTAMKENNTKGVIQIIHTTDQTYIFRVIGHGAVGTVFLLLLVICDSGHADFGM